MATVTPTFTRIPTPTSVVQAIPTPLAMPALTPVTPAPTPITPDTGWTALRLGLERRVINLFDDQGQHAEALYILRLDPAYYRFGLVYHAKEPQTLESWQAETEALIVVNGGYFRQAGEVYIPTGLTIVGGRVIGSSYGSFAGMLAVTDDGPELRWLEQTPYNPDEPLLAALQSFPLLVKPGGELGFPEQHEDHKQAHRTVIGQDRQKRILFVLTPRGYFTLHQLSRYLVNSDLALDIALNLDGGKSSGLLVADPPEHFPAFSPLPLVITVHPR